MAQFTVRVELHNATADQYESLHSRMDAAKFNRFVAGVDATGAKGLWQLPTAEYDYEADTNANSVRDQVKIIADSVKPGAWVLVTQIADRSWHTAKIRN